MALSTSNLALIFGSIVGTGAAGVAVRAIAERRRTARRDTIADRDGLIEHAGDMISLLATYEAA